jgi:hypothetical protein
MESIAIAEEISSQFADVVACLRVPGESEASTHAFHWNGALDTLANCYFAIVAICHQTSPVGAPRLEGVIGDRMKSGWDYLKEKYLLAALVDSKWADPTFWLSISPAELSQLYEDSVKGVTLTRIEERSSLLNNLGRQLLQTGSGSVTECFGAHGKQLDGASGFLQYLSTIEAYRDPVRKKSLFFLSLANKECGWTFASGAGLSSPVDYHEIRGHLRIGTVQILNPDLLNKIESGVALTETEDTALRQKVQEVNDRTAKETGNSSSVIHYLCWNIFRNCCPRDSTKTHCTICDPLCALPAQYTHMVGYQNKCVFSEICMSANKANKVVDPPYLGDFY